MQASSVAPTEAVLAVSSVEQKTRMEKLLGGSCYHLADKGQVDNLNVREIVGAITGQVYPDTQEGVEQAANDFVDLMKGRETV